MKVLTLTQPWASLVANGEKQIETRSWRTNYRGPIAIHAAKGFPREDQRLCKTEPFLSSLKTEEEVLPTGVILCTCLLVDCKLMEDRDATGRSYGHFFDIGSKSTLTEKERAFGYYDEDRFAWFLSDVKKLNIPVPAKGSLGLWDFDLEKEMAAVR